MAPEAENSAPPVMLTSRSREAIEITSASFVFLRSSSPKFGALYVCPTPVLSPHVPCSVMLALSFATGLDGFTLEIKHSWPATRMCEPDDQLELNSKPPVQCSVVVVSTVTVPLRFAVENA